MTEMILFTFLGVWSSGFILMMLAFYFFEMEDECEYRGNLDYPRFQKLTNGDILILLFISIIPIFSIFTVISCIEAFMKTRSFKRWSSKSVRTGSKGNKDD